MHVWLFDDCMFDYGLAKAKLGHMVACTWGCSSVVERLVRNQKVARSSLVSSTTFMVQNLAGILGLSDREGMVADCGKQKLPSCVCLAVVTPSLSTACTCFLSGLHACDHTIS